MNRRITIAQVLLQKPCEAYPLDVLWELAPRGSLTVWEILHLEIPVKDRLWAVLREDVLPVAVLHELACRYAERVLYKERAAGREPDPRSWTAVAAKRAWVRGEISDKQLLKIKDAARAAYDEADEAAYADASWAAHADDETCAPAVVEARKAARAAWAAEAAWAAANFLDADLNFIDSYDYADNAYDVYVDALNIYRLKYGGNNDGAAADAYINARASARIDARRDRLEELKMLLKETNDERN